MSTLLNLPEGENSLLAAYKAIEESGTFADADLVKAAYEQHFEWKALPPSAESKAFERISLVDPSIRMVVRSSTAA